MNYLIPILAQNEVEPSPVATAIGGIFYLGVIVLFAAALWKIFVKAGKPGWAAIIPFYNYVVLFEITGRPIWWLVLLFIPIVNIVIGIILAIDLAKSFGKSAGFGVGIALLTIIFLPILGFGSDEYQGPSVQS